MPPLEHVRTRLKPDLLRLFENRYLWGRRPMDPQELEHRRERALRGMYRRSVAVCVRGGGPGPSIEVLAFQMTRTIVRHLSRVIGAIARAQLAGRPADVALRATQIELAAVSRVMQTLSESRRKDLGAFGFASRAKLHAWIDHTTRLEKEEEHRPPRIRSKVSFESLPPEAIESAASRHAAPQIAQATSDPAVELRHLLERLQSWKGNARRFETQVALMSFLLTAHAPNFSLPPDAASGANPTQIQRCLEPRAIAEPRSTRIAAHWSMLKELTGKERARLARGKETFFEECRARIETLASAYARDREGFFDHGEPRMRFQSWLMAWIDEPNVERTKLRDHMRERIERTKERPALRDEPFFRERPWLAAHIGGSKPKAKDRTRTAQEPLS